jgi:predicted nucleotidyltransferase
MLAVLRGHEAELRAKGVAGLALFGSTARGVAGPVSDVDLILDLDESATLGLLDLVELKEVLAAELARPVDIAFRSRLRPWFAARIAPDLVRVF